MGEINLIPLINVVFILLIFFMMVGRIEKSDTLRMRLPMTQDAGSEPNEPSVVMIYLDPTGRIAVNQDFVAKEDLAVIIKTALLEDAKKPVRIKADAQLPATTLIWVMNTLEKAGAQYVSIVTQRKPS